MIECRENVCTPWGKAFTMIALLFLLSCVNSWADCVSIGGEWSSLEGSLGCYNQYPSTHTCYSGDVNAISSSNPWYQNAGCSGGTKRCVQLSAEFVRCSYASGGNQVCDYTGLRCTSQCDVDSVQCVNDGMSWNEDPSAECGKSCGGQCPDPGAEQQCTEQGGVWVPYPDCECTKCDSTYHCETVFTENNVLRSNITLTDCNGAVLQERQVIGTCSENNFCEGDNSGLDSCSYPNTPDPEKCRSGGQNGSLCTYVCADGNLYSCRIAWTPGQPSEYQPCPSTPPSNCVGPSSSSSQPPVDSTQNLPDTPYNPSSSSGSPTPPSEDCPECDILEEILDTLHRANEQRRFQNYVIDSIKNDVGGFGVKFDAIVANTRGTVTSMNTSNGLLGDIKASNKHIADKLDDLDLDNLTATVDSVVVHVNIDSIGGGSQDSTSPPSWVFFDLDSLPVWRDTVSRIHRTQERISEQIDSLANDSTNAITKYLPFLKKVSDKLDDMTRDCEGVSCIYRPVIDTLVGKMYDKFGLDTVSLVDENDIKNKIIPIDDSTYIDGNFYCEEHPGADVCVEIDSTDLLEFIKPDSITIPEFLRWHDSTTAYYDSVLQAAKDTAQDTLGLDELAGDSAKIREKLNFLFLPENTIEQCFEFRLNTAFGRWTYNLVIDFADLFGLDLCDLIRRIVRILTFILIVVSTIKGYIRAFGGGGPGGG